MAELQANELDLTPPTADADLADYLARNFGILNQLLSRGVNVTDTFTTTDGKTVTVKEGIVQSIV